MRRQFQCEESAKLSQESNAPTTWLTPMCPLLLLKMSVFTQSDTAHSRMKKFEAKIAEKHVTLLPSNGLKNLLECYEVS